MILLAGKGHETEQEIGTQRVHLDEREEIASFSNRIRYNIRSARPSPWREGGGPQKERIEVEKRGGVREWIPF